MDINVYGKYGIYAHRIIKTVIFWGAPNITVLHPFFSSKRAVGQFPENWTDWILAKGPRFSC